MAAALIAGLLSLIGLLFHGQTGVEKTLTRLVMPLGAVWLLLTGWLAQQLLIGPRTAALMPFTAWLVLTATSCGPISEMATRYLETRVPTVELSEQQPLDAIVVLGGGTSQGPTRAQAASGGDRVLYAAQLYHQGRTKKLITTGTAIHSMFGQTVPSPSEQTIEIWTALGIPRQDIFTLPGINTYREIESLKRAMQSELAGKRIGLLTSATHIPRAMRLARAQGLNDLIPIAADYRGNSKSRTFPDYLPGADALAQFSRCQHEFMARFVGR